MADLLQVQQALPPQVRGFEELHCKGAHPAARAPPQPCAPALSPPPVTRRCRPSPGAPAVPPHAVPGCCPLIMGGGSPRHPAARALSLPGILSGSCWLRDVGHRCARAPSPHPFSSPGMGRAERSRAAALAFSPPPAPGPLPVQVLPPQAPMPRGAAMGPLLGCAAPPRTAPAPSHCCHSPSWGAPQWERGGCGTAVPAPPRPPLDSSPTHCLVYAGLGLVDGMGRGTPCPAAPHWGRTLLPLVPGEGLGCCLAQRGLGIPPPPRSCFG